jgi:hypothetical protein
MLAGSLWQWQCRPNSICLAFDFPHCHHGIERALCFFATGSQCVGQYEERDLPGYAPLVFAPAAVALLAAVPDNRFPPGILAVLCPQRFTTQTDKQALEAVRAASHARVDRVMVHLDKIIGERNHVYKDKRSVADAYAFVMASWTTNFPKTWQAYPNVARVMESVKADPAVQRVLELSKK